VEGVSGGSRGSAVPAGGGHGRGTVREAAQRWAPRRRGATCPVPGAWLPGGRLCPAGRCCGEPCAGCLAAACRASEERGTCTFTLSKAGNQLSK